MKQLYRVYYHLVAVERLKRSIHMEAQETSNSQSNSEQSPMLEASQYPAILRHNNKNIMGMGAGGSHL
jgi:hypothetical protein